MKVLIALVASVIVAQGVDGYEEKMDKIDMEALMQNDQLLKKHFDCIIDGKNCTPENKDLEKYIPEIMETCCAKCSTEQKESIVKITKYLTEKKPEFLKRFLDKYDPARKSEEKCNKLFGISLKI
ncbi:hypothetical protein HHI36_011795 [Cryptolaemus montrouzieri]|uniref:Chemosensory protein n=1 Tax=Cryptolaemus montrouzieri TaxID=559131 RepID=A0ABD2NCD0_9CUCU